MYVRYIYSTYICAVRVAKERERETETEKKRRTKERKE